MTRSTETEEWSFLHIRGEGYLVMIQFSKLLS